MNNSLKKFKTVKKMSSLYILEATTENNHTVKIPNEIIDNFDMNNIIPSINSIYYPYWMRGFSLYVEKQNDYLTTKLYMYTLRLYFQESERSYADGVSAYEWFKSSTFDLRPNTKIATQYIIGGGLTGMGSSNLNATQIQVDIYVDGKFYKNIKSSKEIGKYGIFKYFELELEFDFTEYDIIDPKSVKFQYSYIAESGYVQTSGIILTALEGCVINTVLYDDVITNLNDLNYKVDLIYFKEV